MYSCSFRYLDCLDSALAADFECLWLRYRCALLGGSVILLSRVEIVTSEGAVDDAYDFVVDAAVLRDECGRGCDADAVVASVGTD